MMISFESGNNKFHYRAAGIIIHENKVLIQRISNDTLWFIPGGRVEFNEPAEETIEREMREEYAISISNKKLVWIVETFVKFPDERRLHEVGLYYFLDIEPSHKIFHYNDEFIGEEDGFINKWVQIEKLGEYKIVPEFVVPELKQLDINKSTKHIVHRSVR